MMCDRNIITLYADVLVIIFMRLDCVTKRMTIWNKNGPAVASQAACCQNKAGIRA
jgi:hypothetical protein